MNDDYDIENFVMSAGFESFEAYIKYFCAPFVGVGILAFFIFMVLFASIPIYVPIFILILSIFIPVIYPVMIRQKKRRDIMQNLSYFITYSTAISLLDLDLNKFFTKLSGQYIYGELASISNRILYIAHYWTLGFAKTCHKIAKHVPLKFVSDFFDRFGLALDFGHDLSFFLREEQEAIMDDFKVEFTKVLEKIRSARDIFTSLFFLSGYSLVISLLIPMLMGVAVESVMKGVLGFSIIIDVFLLVFITSFVSDDSIHTTFKLLTKVKINLYVRLVICIFLTVVALILVFILTDFPLLVKVSIGCLPLVYVGFYAKKMDDQIYKKDRIYPEFIRTLGATLKIKKMDFRATLNAIEVHDFGSLNDILESIRRRFRVGSDKYQCWDYFCAESGSAMITRFNKIFVETTTMGADPIEISDIISKNFTKVLSLKRLRRQLASGFRGALYGAIASFSLVAYFAVEITGALSQIFNMPTEGMDPEGIAFFKSSMGGLLPDSLVIDTGLVYAYIGIIVIIHSLISAYILKHLDGGSKISGLLDMVLILIVGAVMSLVIPFVFDMWPIL